MEEYMKSLFAYIFMLGCLSSQAFASDCQRPAQGKCVSCPNGGEHTGASTDGRLVNYPLKEREKVCVAGHETIGGGTFARFSSNGSRWPTEDWAVKAENFCFRCND
jgi:hypothetical protein